MPELPDLALYLDALEERVGGETLTGIRIASPFILRSVEPGVSDLAGRKATGFTRLGKRLVISLDGDYHIVIHLMIAGRLQWHAAGKKLPAKLGLAAFDFATGTLVLTEASQKKRASLHLVQGSSNLDAFDPGGLDVMASTPGTFREALTRENHTLKRSMTDQKFLSGIGNAYSDEILHHARISPMRQARHLTDEEWERLHASTLEVLALWVQRLKDKAKGNWPKKVTAFQEEMAVHGKYKSPCPDCGNPVQRIRYANNECNYCAACQNQGNILADRSLSRLLHRDWPKTLEELDSD